MIGVDTNILIYAHRGEAPFHLQAVSALDRLAASGLPWGTVWQCIHEFTAGYSCEDFQPPQHLGRVSCGN